ncbi:MAG: 2-isopropylmalate synthase [Planctomycetes bacterium]|nr:2-isopropylmalate synthase [Planctomycetota bacterium]MBI3846296.1 2-isopropylmalate synthase [Planctomycetota bacterium]
MPDTNHDDLIHDWNRDRIVRERAIQFDDETLRDGLQSPSVNTPPIEDKIRCLHFMEALGIQSANVGLPGAGTRSRDDIAILVGEIAREKLHVAPNVACRTVVADIEPVVEITQKAGMPVEVSMFIGSSEIRRTIENWSLDGMLKTCEESLAFCARNQLPVMFVTEDTTRARPDTIRALYGAAVNGGARRICLCDTAGHVTPNGVHNLVSFVRREILAGQPDVRIDWHGHNDRGLGLINTLAAVEAGVDRVHGTILGIGERCGNAPLDQVLVNLKLLGVIPNVLRRLPEYCQFVSSACGVPIPMNYPVVGKDAFETATGVHAAAVVKALRRGDSWLANRVYSGVPADEFGLEQVITIGPMSGRSNVVYWLEKHGVRVTDVVVEQVLAAAKKSSRVLRDEEILDLVR